MSELWRVYVVAPGNGRRSFRLQARPTGGGKSIWGHSKGKTREDAARDAKAWEARLNEAEVTQQEARKSVRRRKKAKQARGFVYFIRNARSRSVKIGWAFEPHKRRSILQIGCEDRLVLECFAPGSQATEAALHQFLAGSLVNGEWFAGEAVDREVAAWKALASAMVDPLASGLIEWARARLE